MRLSVVATVVLVCCKPNKNPSVSKKLNTMQVNISLDTYYHGVMVYNLIQVNMGLCTKHTL